MQSEFLRFTADDNLANHMIHSQNGTLSTALPELVTNGLDKGSPSIAITLTDRSFEVQFVNYPDGYLATTSHSDLADSGRGEAHCRAVVNARYGETIRVPAELVRNVHGSNAHAGPGRGRAE